MWLPVQFSLSRNATVAAIAAGKYANIRGIFSPSADTPTVGGWQTAQQAIQDGNETSPTYSLFQMVLPSDAAVSPCPAMLLQAPRCSVYYAVWWVTVVGKKHAQQPTMPDVCSAFDDGGLCDCDSDPQGAACWYFAQGLAERGLSTPIGIADTAIGGQRIQEFMNNASFPDAVPCPSSVGGKEVRTAWSGQLFAKQVMPFVDMTVKGWTWYQVRSERGVRPLAPGHCAFAPLRRAP